MQTPSPFFDSRHPDATGIAYKTNLPLFPLNLPRFTRRAPEVALPFQHLNFIDLLYRTQGLSSPGIGKDYHWNAATALWEPVGDRLFKYHPDGTLLETVVTRQRPDGEPSRQIYLYNSLGHLTESALYAHSPKGWELVCSYRIHYVYGYRNRLEEQFSEWYDPAASRWHQNTRFVFFYEGLKTCFHEYWRFRFEDDKWRPNERYCGIDWHKLANGCTAMSAYTLSKVEDGDWIKKENYTAHYTESGYEAVYHTRQGSRWKPTQKVTYEHRPAGDTILLRRCANGKWQKIMRHTYKKDDTGAHIGWIIEKKKPEGWVRAHESNCLWPPSPTGHEIDEIWQHWDQAKGAFVNRERCLYANFQQFSGLFESPEVTGAFHVFSQPSSDRLLVQPRNDEEKLHGCYLLDLEGKVVADHWHENGDHQVELSLIGLGRGAYFLHIETEKGQFLGKYWREMQ